MSAPTDGPFNPHMPLRYVPTGLDNNQLADLCNYTALNAVAYELNKVRSGHYTFGELQKAIDNFTARADEIADERWPTLDHKPIAPSAILANNPAPKPPPASGADTPTPGAPAAFSPELPASGTSTHPSGLLLTGAIT